MLRLQRCAGFTLIELLTVVAIIGILVAIAIPQFASYRQRGFDARAEGDIRNVATAEEAYFADNSAYKSCDQSNCGGVLPGTSLLSDGVQLSMTGTTTAFSGTSNHPKGSGVTCHWDSGAQGLLGCY